jgi:hypothetical protein
MNGRLIAKLRQLASHREASVALLLVLVTLFMSFASEFFLTQRNRCCQRNLGCRGAGWVTSLLG